MGLSLCSSTSGNFRDTYKLSYTMLSQVLPNVSRCLKMSQVSRNYHVGSWETQLVAPNRSPNSSSLRIGIPWDTNRSELLRPNHLISGSSWETKGENRAKHLDIDGYGGYGSNLLKNSNPNGHADRVTVAIQF